MSSPKLHVNRVFMKLNGYCGNRSFYVNLSEYQTVIQKSHTQQGGRVNLPCVFLTVCKYSHIFFFIYWAVFWYAMQEWNCCSHNTQEQQYKLEELIYALFPLNYANWKASKALAIWCKWYDHCWKLISMCVCCMHAFKKYTAIFY